MCDISMEDALLVPNDELKPEMAEKLQMGEEIPDQSPIPLGLLSGEGDRYIVTDGRPRG